MDQNEIKVRAEMASDETLIWTGEPYRGLRLRPIDALLIPFSVVWGSGMAFVIIGTALTDKVAVALLIGCTFGLAAVYVTVGRFFLDMRRRKRTIYGLTDKRAIIVSGANVRSVRISDPWKLVPKFHRGGRVTLQFGTSPPLFSSGSRGIWSGKPDVPTFEMVEDGRHVLREVRRLIGP